MFRVHPWLADGNLHQSARNTPSMTWLGWLRYFTTGSHLINTQPCDNGRLFSMLRPPVNPAAVKHARLHRNWNVQCCVHMLHHWHHSMHQNNIGNFWLYLLRHHWLGHKCSKCIIHCMFIWHFTLKIEKDSLLPFWGKEQRRLNLAESKIMYIKQPSCRARCNMLSHFVEQYVTIFFSYLSFNLLVRHLSVSCRRTITCM